MGSPSETSKAARLQNDFGADYWVRNKETHRVSIPTYYFHYTSMVNQHSLIISQLNSKPPLDEVSSPVSKMSSTTTSTMAGRVVSRVMLRLDCLVLCGIGRHQSS